LRTGSGGARTGWGSGRGWLAAHLVVVGETGDLPAIQAGSCACLRRSTHQPPKIWRQLQYEAHDMVSYFANLESALLLQTGGELVRHTSKKPAAKPKKATSKRSGKPISASQKQLMLAAFRQAAAVTVELQTQRRVDTSSLYEQMTL